MFEKLIQLIQKDLKVAMLIVSLFALYHLVGYLKTFIDREVIKNSICEDEKKIMQYKLDSANIAIIELLKLNQMRNDTVK